MLTFPIEPIWTINLDHPATRVAARADAAQAGFLLRAIIYGMVQQYP